MRLGGWSGGGDVSGLRCTTYEGYPEKEGGRRDQGSKAWFGGEGVRLSLQRDGMYCRNHDLTDPSFSFIFPYPWKSVKQ